MNLYDTLRASHEVQRTLCRRLVRTKDAEVRDELFKTLKVELSAHEAAEERFFYVPLLMNDAGLDVSRHALAEHHQIDELLEKLEKSDPKGDAWHEVALELSAKVHHHLHEEETRFFQVSGKLLTEKQKTQLAANYQRDYQRLHAA
ncbi:MAG: hemerythrin [Archangium gephyra]|uniref:Hemerythrin n=1 Tax=Archangium gephyra TaxID=48 RepID=A0A2W5VTC9_9BACT|nr:MAG: hemerythrin [Archangium gephyra]